MSRKLRHMTDVVTDIKDLSHGVTYEVLLRSGERFRAELATVGNRSAWQVVKFELVDGSVRYEHAVEFVSATPVT